MKKEEYASCKHILVYSNIEHDRSCGCIKCGLDNSVLSYDRKNLLFSYKIMYDYLRKKYLDGMETQVACNLNLAQAIYSKIKEAHPSIDDKTAIYYFQAALHDIRNIEVSEERKASRAKRLSLSPNFSKWYGRDVHHG